MKMKTLVAAALAWYAESVLGCPTTPAESIARGLLKAPLITPANSGPNQWAGRTTLSSGSASVTVSTQQVNSDSMIFTTIEAALVAGYTTQGRVNIASGTSFGTASTVAIYSGDVVGLAWESPNAITSGQALRVDSIVGGISFAIATSNSLTTVASGAVAMWKLHGKDPDQVKVNSIRSGSYFTVGWPNGIAKPVDATVMWELRKTS